MYTCTELHVLLCSCSDFLMASYDFLMASYEFSHLKINFYFAVRRKVPES